MNMRFKVLSGPELVEAICDRCQYSIGYDSSGNRVAQFPILVFDSQDDKSGFLGFGKSVTYIFRCPQCGTTARFQKKGDSVILLEM